MSVVNNPTLKPTFYQRPWAWLGDNAEAELSEIQQVLGTPDLRSTVKAISDRGFSIVIKVQDGQTEENVGFAKQVKEWRRQSGIDPKRLLVAGWSQNRTEAKDDAEKTNGLIIREGLDAFQTSWEFECKGSPDSAEYKRMKTFVDRVLGFDEFAAVGPCEPFRTLAMQGGWIYVQMPNEPNGGWIDWASVRRLYGRWGPECYPNDPSAQNPSMWPDAAQGSGAKQFAKSYIHPVLGFYGDNPIPAVDYIASMKRATSLGFTYGYGVYLAFHLTRSDWDAFARVNRPAGVKDALAWF